MKTSTALHCIVLLLATFVTASCSLFKKDDYAEYSGGPVKYPSDGHYNPYPQGKVKPAASKPPVQDSSSVTETTATEETKPATKSSTKKKSSNTAATTTSPKSSSSGTTHIVKPGDTYWSLAKKYHTTITALKKANNRTSDILRDGEKIKIP